MMADEKRTVRVSLTQDQVLGEESRMSLQSYVANLTVPQKLELAVKGNREVRQILSRDPSSLVARAVMNSPRLTDADVVSFAGSALTSEDLLRGIAEDREWSKNSRVKLLLVSNPRTPPAVALRFLGHLPASDLGALARNRNISSIIRREAKNRLTRIRT